MTTIAVPYLPILRVRSGDNNLRDDLLRAGLRHRRVDDFDLRALLNDCFLHG